VPAELSDDRVAEEDFRGEGQAKLFDEYRYFFYITNDRTSTARRWCFAPMTAATRRT